MEDWRIETYLLHAHSRAFQRRLAIAKSRISEALATGLQWYVAWSGGKDSNALLHLVREQAPDVPILHVRTPLDYPDCAETVDRWIKEWGLRVIILRPQVDPWEILDRHGGPEGQVNEARSELDRKCFFEPIQDAVEQHGFTGAFLGLRKYESKARLRNRATRGYLYTKRDGMMVCTPLCDWTTQDVFAYHVLNGLPWLPVYERTAGHPDPERIREGWFLPGANAARHGGLVWLKYHYPELYREIAKRYPAYAAQV